MATEKRLIDANFLDDRCRRQMADEWNKKVAPVSWSEAYKEFLDDVWDAPIVDAVEVVRCKDCKHFWESFSGTHSCKLHKGLVGTKHDAFCSYGERKDDATD